MKIRLPAPAIEPERAIVHSTDEHVWTEPRANDPSVSALLNAADSQPWELTRHAATIRRMRDERKAAH